MTTKTFLVTTISAVVVFARADQVVMQNGDRYSGKVLSVTTNTLVLQSEVLGTVSLPHDKVSVITLGSETATNLSQLVASPAAANRAPSATQTNADSGLSALFSQLGTQTNLIQQVQAQFLSAAGPEANSKFSEMMSELGGGKMTITDLRAEAKSAADQLRALEKDGGGDDSGTADMYLSVLDSFLQETASSGQPATNATSALPKTEAASVKQPAGN